MTPDRRSGQGAATRRLLLAVMWVFVVVMWPAWAAALELHFIDLQENGAATLIIRERPDGTRASVLVDTGPQSVDPERGAAKVKAYLASIGATHVDLVVLTQFDADHAGGLKTILSEPSTGPSISVGTVIEPGVSPNQKQLYGDVSTLMSRRGVRRLTPAIANEIGALEGYGMWVLSGPWFDRRATGDNSLVVGLRTPTSGRDYFLAGYVTARAFEIVKPQLPTTVLALQAPRFGSDPVVVDMMHRTPTDALVIHAALSGQSSYPKLSVMRRLAQYGFEPILDGLRESRRRLFQENSGTQQSASALPRQAETTRDRAAKYLNDLAARPPTPAGGGHPLFFDRVLITGDVGNVVIAQGQILTQKMVTEEHQLFLELSWSELRNLTDAEFGELRTFREAQAYGLFKAKRLLEAARARLGSGYWLRESRFLQEPWLLELELVVKRVSRISTTDRREIGAAVERVWKAGGIETLARSFVTAERASRLERAANDTSP